MVIAELSIRQLISDRAIAVMGGSGDYDALMALVGDARLVLAMARANSTGSGRGSRGA